MASLSHLDPNSEDHLNDSHHVDANILAKSPSHELVITPPILSDELTRDLHSPSRKPK